MMSIGAANSELMMSGSITPSGIISKGKKSPSGIIISVYLCIPRGSCTYNAHRRA